MPTESERNADYPVHIDLGRSMKDSAITEPVTDQEMSDKKSYPSLYISGIKDLDKIPEDGCVLVKLHRRSLTKNDDGTASGDFEVRSICLPEDGGAEASGDEEGDGMEGAVDAMAKKAGVIGKKAEDAGEKYGEDDEAEQP